MQTTPCGIAGGGLLRCYRRHGLVASWHRYISLAVCQCLSPLPTLAPQHPEPLALLGALHYAAITDLAWSRDGRFLAVSSYDGYCSLAAFAPGELGEPLSAEELPPKVAAALRRPAVGELQRSRSYPRCITCVHSFFSVRLDLARRALSNPVSAKKLLATAAAALRCPAVSAVGALHCSVGSQHWPLVF